MTSPRRFVQETATLAPKKADGSYPVVIITEGEGSSGRYSRELLERSEAVFSNVGSFLNHPIDPQKPHLRRVEDLAGRIGECYLGEDKGKRAILSDYKPRKEYAEFVEEYQDLLKLSIFCGADGEVMEDGRLDVQEFFGDDPYRSVDIVVAAGRGGRFKQAEESLRLIESSLGLPEGIKPGVTSASQEKEGNMELKDVVEALNALTESLKPVIAFVNESKTAKEQTAQAQVDAEAVESAVTEALSSYDEKVVAIEAAELLAPQVEDLKAAARKGEDITEQIARAKVVAEAATKRVTEGDTHVIEALGANAGDFSFSFGGRR